MNNKKPIFIHSLFRTGSTYIWNKFRQKDNYYCYYEPLHPALAKVTEKNIEDLMTKDYSSVNHPSLAKYYLYEYLPLLDKTGPGVLHFKKSFSFDEFCHNENNPALKKYIDHLIDGVEEKIPLLQFNRTALRTKWFKQNYPNSINIYMVRKPRDQWQSYFEIQQKTQYAVFFIMDLLITGANKQIEQLKPLANVMPLMEHHDLNFEKEEKFYQALLDFYPKEERYFIFYYLWLKALIENIRHADFVLNINLLSQDPSYREVFIDFLRKNDIDDIDFKDSRISEYTSYQLSPGVMAEIEKDNRQLLLQFLPRKHIDQFFERISPFDKTYFQFHKKSFLKDKSKGLTAIDTIKIDIKKFEKFARRGIKL